MYPQDTQGGEGSPARSERPENGLGTLERRAGNSEGAGDPEASGNVEGPRNAEESGDAENSDEAQKSGDVEEPGNAGESANTETSEALDDRSAAANQYLGDAVDTIQEIFFVFSLGEGMLSWNERVNAVTGYDDSELSEIDPLSLIAPDHREHVAETIAAVATEGEAETEADLLTRSGERIPYEFTASLLSGPDEPPVLCGTGRDVSDKRRREAELREQAQRLKTLNHVNAVIRDVNDALVRADTRAEIESAVCEHLVTAEPYELAWIGDLTITGDRVEPRAKAGGATDYVDARPVHTDGGFTAVDAIKTDETRVVESIAEESGAEPWRDAALSRGLEAAVAVPLSYRETNYGVLCVYAQRTGAFGETERAVLTELGETIGYAVAATEQRRALVSDTVVEVELEFSPPGPYFFRLATESEQRLELEGVVEDENGVSEFFEVTGDAEAVDDATAAAGGDVSLVSASDQGSVIRIDPDEPSIAALVAHYGGVLEGAHADQESGYARLELPAGADVRTVVEAIARAYDGTRLLSQRERDRTGSRGLEFRDSFDEALTDRQRQVIETAYHAGFFGWPRNASAEEVAESLDIAPPTFHEHLRRAEEKLLTAYFEADGRE